MGNSKGQRKRSTVYTFCYFVLGFLLGVYLLNTWALMFLKHQIIYCLKLKSLQHRFEPNELQPLLRDSSEPNDIPVLNQYPEPFLFIGVMTTRKYLKTRARAIGRTWGKDVPGKIVFFVGKGEPYRGKLPVIVLDEVADNSYPPQKKSFAMLKYINDHYLDYFEWFMRADDDIFIKPKSLGKFLRSINSWKRIYMGQPGLGVPAERGKLGLRNDSFFFCMGGPGILFTRETLREAAMSLDLCLQHTFTKHEDTELGRCVNQQTGISCTAAYEFSTLFYQNRVDRQGSFRGHMDPRLTFALTLHPVKQSEHVYRLQSLFNIKDILQLKRKVWVLENAILDISSKLSEDLDNKPKEPARILLHKRSTDQAIEADTRDVMWNFIRRGQIYANTHPHNNPQENVVLRGRQLRINATLATLKRFKPKSKNPVFYYERVDPGIGLEHVIALGNKTFFKPYAAIQRFKPTEIAEIPPPTRNENDIIYMILPLFRRPKTFANFLTSLNTAAHNFKGNIVLRVVIYQDRDGDYLTTLNYYKEFTCLSERLDIDVFQLVGQFSKVKAMNKGVEDLSPDSLILFMDVDMVFTASFLDRVILNTKQYKLAYFPISFSRYDPHSVCYNQPGCRVDRNGFQINQNRGTWRHFGFGIVGIYKSDFTRVGGLDASILGWGKEDTLFYEDCVNYGFPVFRSIEPGLVHVHHVKYCDIKLPDDQFKMCMASRAEMYGSQSVVADLAFNYTQFKYADDFKQ